MWHKIHNGIYRHKNAIKETDLNYILDKMKSVEYYQINSEDRQIYINKTFYNYNQSKYEIYKDTKALTVIKNLVDKCFLFTGQKMNTSNVDSSFKLSTKFFNENSSYGLHFEDPTYFGNYFFVLYLDDCVEGDLVFPTMNMVNKLLKNQKENKEEWEKGVIHLKKNGYSPLFVDREIKIRPEKNTALLAKIPLVHYVNNIIKNGNNLQRPVINGFFL